MIAIVFDSFLCRSLYPLVWELLTCFANAGYSSDRGEANEAAFVE